MTNPDLFNADLLEDLFAAAAPGSAAAPGGGKDVFDVDAADKDACCQDGGGACSDGAPRLPPAVRAALSDSSWTTTSSLETASPPSPPPPVSAPLVVPRKKRDMSVKRGKRLWSLDMPSVPASRDSASGGDGDHDGRRVGVSGGGVRQRLLGAARPRNRQTQRACRHCDSTETPQWRAGPDGPGTLCNACGIRYTMNKLLPEYRPSTSPSFRSDKHSNRHRKVVELRETKVLKEKAVNMLLPPDYANFMDVCKYISTGQ